MTDRQMADRHTHRQMKVDRQTHRQMKTHTQTDEGRQTDKWQTDR